MTEIDIAALRALLERATPGPWQNDLSYLYGFSHSSDERATVLGRIHGKPDTNLIVGTVNSFPALLDEIERLRAELFEARDEIDHPAEGCACRFHPRTREPLHICLYHRGLETENLALKAWGEQEALACTQPLQERIAELEAALTKIIGSRDFYDGINTTEDYYDRLESRICGIREIAENALKA